jgi:hypothetical protein
MLRVVGVLSLQAHKNHLRDHQLALISEKRTSLREKTRQIKSKNVSIGAGIKIDDQVWTPRYIFAAGLLDAFSHVCWNVDHCSLPLTWSVCALTDY